MTIADFSKQELERHFKAQQSAEDNALDCWFAHQLLEIIPPFFEECSKRDLFSNQTVAETFLHILERLMRRKPLSPIQAINKAPEDWVETAPIDPNLIDCKRCPSVFYDNEEGTYFDVDARPIFRDRFSGVSWSGKPIDVEKVKSIIPNFMGKYLSVFDYTTDITMPYYPPSNQTSVEIDWYDEFMCDVANFLVNFKNEDEKETNIATYTRCEVCVYYLNEFKRVIIIFDLYDDMTKVRNCPYLVLPYEYELSVIPNLVTSTIKWLTRYLDTSFGFIEVEGPVLDRDHKIPGSFPASMSAVKEATTGYLIKKVMPHVNILASMKQVFIYNRYDGISALPSPNIRWREVKEGNDIAKLNSLSHIPIVRSVYNTLQDYDEACKRRAFEVDIKQLIIEDNAPDASQPCDPEKSST